MPANRLKRFINRVYTTSPLSSAGAFICFLTVVIVLLTIFLQPHLSARFFNVKRSNVYADFIATVASNSALDAKTFWKFREEYAPGFFTFSPVVTFGETQVITALPSETEALHVFTSPHLVSRDYIRTHTQDLLNRAVLEVTDKEVNNFSDEDVIFQSNDTFIASLNQESATLLVFTKPIKELYATNGLFDFRPNERLLLGDRVWVNTTIIYLQ